MKGGDNVLEYYVYCWQDIDSGEVIYVGQGKEDRYKRTDKNARNRLFNEYAVNHEIYPFILIHGMTEDESIRKESQLVRYYKGIGQCVCNIAADGYRSMPGETNPNYGNGQALKDTYKKHPELKFKTRHCGTENGRARPILVTIDGQKLYFCNVTFAAQYLIDSGISNGSLNTVRGAIATRIRQGKTYCKCEFQYM